jgi:hypothetical protein
MSYMAKAWVAFFGAILTAFSAGLSDDVFDLNDTTQVVVTAVMALGTLYATYRTRNRVDVLP